MPAAIDESIKRKVIQQWITGESRDKIAAENNIGNGSVSSIIANYKDGLDSSEFDSIRQLALEIRKQGLNWSDLAPHIRLYNFFIGSGASEEKVESFITNVSSADISPEKEADDILQSKNVSIETINEHVKLNEKLNEYGLSMHNIDELLNLVLNAKRYRFDPKKFVGKLRTIQRLEKKEKRLENNCTILSNFLYKHKETVPLAELIQAMHVGKNELISFKIAVNEAAETYGITHSAAALDVINLIIDHNKKGQLKHELSELTFQKHAISQFCSRKSPSYNIFS